MARPSIGLQISETIIRKLAGGRWREGRPLPPTRRLAAELHVSRGPMQRALRRIAQLGMIQVRPRQPAIVLPGAMAHAQRMLLRLVRLRSLRRIAILVPEIFLSTEPVYPFYNAAIDALSEAFQRRRMTTKLVPWSDKDQLATADSVLHGSCDAAIILGLLPSYLPATSVMHERGFPLVIFNRRPPGLELPTVVMDDYSASQRLAERLVALGHRNLCMVSQQTGVLASNPRERVLGWLEFLAEKSLLDDCSMPIYSPVWTPWLKPYSRAFKMLMFSEEHPTAIVFAHYAWAKDFLKDPDFSSLSVPQDVSLAMFETDRNIATVSWCPPLTTVDINLQRAASCATEVFQHIMAGEEHTPSIRIPMEFHFTDSIGPAPCNGPPNPYG